MSLVTSGEGNAEHSEEVSVGGLGLDVSLDESVPLLDESAKLISSDIESVEVGVAVKSFHFFTLYLYFSPGLLVGLTVQVSERDLEDSVAEGVGGDLCRHEKVRNALNAIAIRSKEKYLL